MKPANIFRNKYLLSCVLLAAMVALPLFTQPSSAAPLQQGAIHKVYIYDITNTSFTVSWTTDSASNGIVHWGTGTPPPNSVADTVASTTTHYVTVSGLAASTTYFISVESGALIDNNGGLYYSVTTGPLLPLYTPTNTIFGTVFEIDGTTPVQNAIVYFRLRNNDGAGSSGDSQWVTVRTDSGGGWFYTLGGMRTQDLTGYFAYSVTTDEIQFVAQGGDKGVIGETGAEYIIPVPSANPAQIDFTLDAVPNAVSLVGFSATSSASNNIALLVGLAVSLLALGGLFVIRRRVRA